MLARRKRWVLFPPSQTDCMYPTRIPYEESSVFSQVNVRSPDLCQHVKYKVSDTSCIVIRGSVATVQKLIL